MIKISFHRVLWLDFYWLASSTRLDQYKRGKLIGIIILRWVPQNLQGIPWSSWKFRESRAFTLESELEFKIKTRALSLERPGLEGQHAGAEIPIFSFYNCNIFLKARAYHAQRDMRLPCPLSRLLHESIAVLTSEWGLSRIFGRRKCKGNESSPV
jgi:hypothetical protein